MLLENVEIEKGQIEKNIVAKNVKGKILKIKYEPNDEQTKVRFRLFTKEGEEIMNVTGKGVYYPRANISQQKMVDNMSMSLSGDSSDYFYFNEGLLLNFSTDNINFEGLIVKRLIIIYDS